MRYMLTCLIVLWAGAASAADRYWCGLTDNWNGTAGVKWATAADCVTGLGAAIPTTSDAVFIGTASLGSTITIAAGNTGCGGLLLHDGLGGNFTGTLAGSTAISNAGVLTLRGNITYSGTMTMSATTGPQAITSNGVTWTGSLTLDGVGGSWVLADALSVAAGKSLTLTNGALDATGIAVSTGQFSSSNSNVRSLTCGTAAWSLTGTATIWTTSTATNLALSCASATVSITDTSTSAKTFTGGNSGVSLPNISIPSGSDGTVTLGGSSPYGTVTSVAAGAAAVVTFATNGASVASLNLAGTGTWSGTQGLTVRGAMTLGASLVRTFTGILTYAATSGTHDITTNGVALASALTFNGVGGTWRLVGDTTTTGAITLTNGVLNVNGVDLTAPSLASSNSNTRSLTCGTADITLNGTSGTPWNLATTTGLTFSCSTNNITLNGSGSGTKTFAGGGQTYQRLVLSGSGTGAFIITGANTFGTLQGDTEPHTLTLPASTTTTVGAFGFEGSAGNLWTINSSSTTAMATLALSSGTYTTDYVSVSGIQATPGGIVWNAGVNSVDAGNNGGWFFPLTNRKALGIAGAGF